MTAPMRLGWFKHRCDPSPRCGRLIFHEGFEGYGRYMRLMEIISSDSDHILADDAEWLASELLMDADDVRGFLSDLVRFGLMEPVEGGWRSPEIDDAEERYARTCARNRENAMKRWTKGGAA